MVTLIYITLQYKFLIFKTCFDNVTVHLDDLLQDMKMMNLRIENNLFNRDPPQHQIDRNNYILEMQTRFREGLLV